MNITTNYTVRPRVAERHFVDVRVTFDDDECALLLKALGSDDILEIRDRLRRHLHNHFRRLMSGAL